MEYVCGLFVVVLGVLVWWHWHAWTVRMRHIRAGPDVVDVFLAAASVDGAAGPLIRETAFELVAEPKFQRAWREVFARMREDPRHGRDEDAKLFVLAGAATLTEMLRMAQRAEEPGAPQDAAVHTAQEEAPTEPWVCAACGAENFARWKVCDACGQPRPARAD